VARNYNTGFQFHGPVNYRLWQLLTVPLDRALYEHQNTSYTETAGI